MTKFTDAVKANLVARFEDGDIPDGPDFSTWISRIQEGIQEHAHVSTGGAGSGTGDAGPINTNRHHFLPACMESTNPPTHVGCYGAVELLDALAYEAYFTFRVPFDFVTFQSVKAVWLSSAVSGNMRWRLRAHYASAGEAYDTNTEDTAAGTTATGGANILNVQAHPNPLALPALSTGDYVGILFTRVGNDPLDTLEAKAYLLGLLLSYANE